MSICVKMTNYSASICQEYLCSVFLLVFLFWPSTQTVPDPCQQRSCQEQQSGLAQHLIQFQENLSVPNHLLLVEVSASSCWFLVGLEELMRLMVVERQN